MGVLKEQGTGREHSLGRKCVIGRDASCHVQVEQKHISNEHAQVLWSRDHWVLHDMGSKNKTYLEGRALGPGEFPRLDRGATFTLGGLLPNVAVPFTLIDEAPPPATAHNTRTSSVREALEGVLVLPDDEKPEVSIFVEPGGSWVAAVDEDTSRKVADGDEIVAGGDRWKLVLNQADPTRTLPLDEPIDSIDTIALRIVVNQNEENHDLIVVRGGRETKLRSKAHFFLVLMLAREWLADVLASPGERGWIDREELCRKLGTTREKLAVDVHRVRKDFSDLNVHKAEDVIERRTGTGQIRLGIANVEIKKS